MKTMKLIVLAAALSLLTGCESIKSLYDTFIDDVKEVVKEEVEEKIEEESKDGTER